MTDQLTHLILKNMQRQVDHDLFAAIMQEPTCANFTVTPSISSEEIIATILKAKEELPDPPPGFKGLGWLGFEDSGRMPVYHSMVWDTPMLDPDFDQRMYLLFEWDDIKRDLRSLLDKIMDDINSAPQLHKRKRKLMVASDRMTTDIKSIYDQSYFIRLSIGRPIEFKN